MPVELKSENRPIIARDESGGAFVVSDMEITETLSQPFQVLLTLISGKFQEKEALGQKLTLIYQPGLDLNRTKQFVLNGVITSVSAVSPPGGKENIIWRLELAPWFGILKLRTQCRIFQNMDAQQIIQSICSDYTFDTSVEFKSGSNLKSRTFCVQYNETDFNFISRLLADDGLHYHFEHSDDSHTMIIGSDSQAFESCSQGDLEFIATASNKTMSLRQWHPHHQIHPETH